MQNPFGGPQPIGVVYITAMSRPDAALALALLYGMQGKRESRMGAVCVNGAGLGAAIYCDIVGRFYMLGPQRNANQVLPVGFAAVDPLPPDPLMVRKAIAGDYVHSIQKVHDTSLPEAVIRNGVIFNAEAVMILSAPATYLAKSLDLLGVRDLYKERVKRLVIVDTGAPQDEAAMRRVLADWPTPIFYCGRDVADAYRLPGKDLEAGFAWAQQHPVRDAYQSFREGTYDVPAYDIAAAHFAVHPESGYFQLSGEGNVKTLRPNPDKAPEAVAKFLEVATAKPVPPQQRRPRTDK